MHCIILHFAPHALHVMSLSHICTFVLDPAESKTEIQAVQAQGVFRGPQALRYEDANIVAIKASPGASHQSPCLLCLKNYL
jgi:hypothetical protein